MEHEFETPPASPAIKVAAGVLVVIVIAVISHAAGFVDLGFGGGDDRVEVSDDGELPSTSEVPETLAFDEDTTGTSGSTDGAGSDGGSADGSIGTESEGDSGGSSTQPTVVQEIELNPEVTSTTTSTSTTTTEAPESSTTEPDETTTTTEAPELDENGDPIEDDPADDYQPVIRTYNDYSSGSS